MKIFNYSILYKSKNWKAKFNKEQLREIRKGIINNENISLYAKDYFNYKQMKVIRLGLLKNVDVSLYAKPSYNENKCLKS